MREASSFCVALRRSRDAPGCGADELDRKNVEPAGNAGVRLNDKIISIGQSIGQNLAERENVMKTKRLWWTICTLFARSGGKRADYARKKNIYAHVGKNVAIHPWVIPLYSELLYFHDNISVAKNVDFVTHDVIHRLLNRLPDDVREGTRFKEHIGCIEIMDNEAIGSNSVILYGTRIGPNVIVASGSVVSKDCEPNSVYAGVPARRIGSFDDYIRKRKLLQSTGDISTTTHNQGLTEEEVKEAWNLFRKDHDSRQPG